jgi:hypothetical protein
MIEKLATLDGLAELQRVLRVEAYDVLEAAAVGLASRSAVSATDLCAPQHGAPDPIPNVTMGRRQSSNG